MEQFDALDVIARTRGKVDMDATPTGDSLFILWGTLTAVFFLLEFALWQVFKGEWCLWLWPGIPLVGGPWMAVLLKKDHDRTHMRTRESKLVLDYWIFVGCASCVSGFVFGFAGVYSLFHLPLTCLLVGIGAFLLQGDLWVWQMLALSVVAFVSLVLPGIQYKRSIRNGV